MLRRRILRGLLLLSVLEIVALKLALCHAAEPETLPVQSSLGERLFIHNWAHPDEWTGPEVLGNEGDGLGPLFNEVSCAACHNLQGPGGAGANEHNAQLLSVELSGPVPRASRAALLRKLRDVHPGLDDAATVVLQKFGLGPSTEPLGYDLWRDELLAHNPAALDPQQVTPVRMEVQGENFEFAQRNTPALWGAGLIDDLSRGPGTAARLQQLHAQEQRTPWITGRIPRTAAGAEGWFGWRGQTDSLHEFVLAACANELGLEVPTRQQPTSPLLNARQRERDQAAQRLDLTGEQCRELTAFVAGLPRPDQVLPFDGTARALVYAGEHLFEQVGCADCHVKQLATLDGVYSDFLLHDMGTDLSDRAASLPEIVPGEKVFDLRSGYSGGGFIRETPPKTLPCNCEVEWRTPPLWGVADSAPYMHDGRAPTLLEAIRCHDGEAMQSRHDFLALSTDERNQVLAFLESLRAPEIAVD
jgi:CxxC motif-containing protein (DUF1111 family)